MGLPGGLAADKASAHPVDLGDEACTALPASDRIAFPVACPVPGRCLFRPLGDVMGYAHLAPALLASLPVPASSMVPEQPCGLPVPRKLAVQGSRLHGTVDGGIAHGEVGPLLRDAARYLLRGPVLVPHGPHDQRAPLGLVHEPGAPAGEPPPVRLPLCRRRAVAAPCRALPAVPPDLAGYGRPVPVELPRYLADPLMALPADHVSSRSAMPRWL